MTTTQLDHLRLLKAHLTNLLEGAKKRDQAKWYLHYQECQTDPYSSRITYLPILKADDYIIAEGYESDKKEADDFHFISSCAGNAEAGWKSTLAAIDACEQIKFTSHITTRIFQEANKTLKSILAAWPIETLH